MSESKEAVLAKITERLRDHDFCGTILDDRWTDHVSTEAAIYLSDEEVVALESLVSESVHVHRWTQEQAMIAEGAYAVLREFVQYLCRLYDVKPEDLRETHNESNS